MHIQLLSFPTQNTQNTWPVGLHAPTLYDNSYDPNVQSDIAYHNNPVQSELRMDNMLYPRIAL